jgi:sulfite exporter TauE/SafE
MPSGSIKGKGKDMDSPAFVALGLGFLLGLKHSSDADHVVAVSTIVSEYRNAFRGIWIGISWGLGHTTPLLIVGVAILLLKGSIVEVYARLSPFLEFGVALMLVFLGGQVLWKLRSRNFHMHDHMEEKRPHVHMHSHTPTLETVDQVDHGFFRPGKPFFRLKSYFVGVIHGLAGGAAVMLVVLATDAVASFWHGIGYIVLFGIGTTFSMGILTLVMGVPFAISGQFERVNVVVSGIAGTISVAFGFILMYGISTARL